VTHRCVGLSGTITTQLGGGVLLAGDSRFSEAVQADQAGLPSAVRRHQHRQLGPVGMQRRRLTYSTSARIAAEVFSHLRRWPVENLFVQARSQRVAPSSLAVRVFGFRTT
jgi:hypothetical protein